MALAIAAIFYFFFSNTPCPGGRLDYDPREVLKVYVGLNDRDINLAIKKYYCALSRFKPWQIKFF